MRELDALAREVGSIGKALRGFTAQQWEAPTRCAPMTIRDLVAHVLRGATRIEEALDADPLDIEPEADALTYWHYDREGEAPRIVARAQESAARFDDAGAVVAAWDTSWSRALRRAREAGDPVVPTIKGGMRLSAYLSTRVIEATVHHMDIDDALGREPHPDAGALEVVGDVLRGLLGTDLRGAGVDDVRFALVGTGRAALDDRERAMLGPLADEFPLLA